jgi:hypothetical protein
MLPHVLWRRTLPPHREGFDAAMRPVVPYVPRASSIKKPSWHVYAARLAYFQGAHTCFQVA